MRRKTLICLDEFIIKGLYDGFVNKPFITLFKKYADKQMKNINDFLSVAEAYVRFVYTNKNDILSTFQNITEAELKSDLNEIASVVNRLKNRENSIVINNYVRMIEYFINKRSKVLDVGAGGVPLSSIKLAKKNNGIEAMDNFLLSDSYIKNLNVTPVSGFFGYNTDVSKYDMIVGLRPCSAIGQIVEVCKKENKPYFLHLCNCGAAEYSLMRFKTLVGNWRQILPEIDHSVKFGNVYATNLDISQEKLNKLVYKKCRLTSEMQSCGMISFMQGFNSAMQSLAKGEEKEIVTSSGVISTKIVDIKNQEWKISNDEKSLGDE